MRDAPSRRANSLIAFFATTSMLGRLFGKKAAENPPESTVTRRVVLEASPPPAPAAPKAAPPTDKLRQGLLFHGLHQDTNPSENVRTANMTCPACNHQFRYFLNSNGRPTTVKCPSCTKMFRL